MNQEPRHKTDSPDMMEYCPKCDYKDGFHISFIPDTSGKAIVLLTCPACHNRFKTSWKIVFESSSD